MRLFAAPAITMHSTPSLVLTAIAITIMVVLLAGAPNLAYAQTATSASNVQSLQNTQATSNTQSATQPSQTQAVKIQGVSYATGVKLGMPVPALIRAKALSQKLNNKKPIKQ